MLGMAIESWGVVGNKVSKEDWNQIVNGLKCHSMELEFIPWVDLAISCGILITGRLLVSEAHLHHLLATWFQAVLQRGFSQSRHRWTLRCKMVTRNQGHERKREEVGQRKKSKTAQQSLSQPDRKFSSKDGLSKLSCIKLKWPGLYPPSHPVTRCPGRSWPCMIWVSAAEQDLKEEAVYWELSGKSFLQGPLSSTTLCLPQAVSFLLYLCSFTSKMEIVVVGSPRGNWEIIWLAYNSKNASYYYLPWRELSLYTFFLGAFRFWKPLTGILPLSYNVPGLVDCQDILVWFHF